MKIRETLVDLDTNTMFADTVTSCDALLLETRGEVYRYGLQEYGRCTGKIFEDRLSGSPVHVGWTFLSRDRYEDRDDTYLREAWVSISGRAVEEVS